jgi:uncharacterized protein
VDIGVHQDGLVHLSQLSNKFIKDPREVVSPGDRVQVKVMEINIEKSQMSLSIRAAAEVTQPRPERHERPHTPHKAAPKSRPEHEHRHGHGHKHKPQPPVKPKQVFNNAFAGLASLKSQLKPK